MSIEANLASIAQSLAALVEHFKAQAPQQAPMPTPVPAPFPQASMPPQAMPQFVPPAPAPMPAPVPAPMPQAMPMQPPPAPAPTPGMSPLTNAAEVMNYCVNKYKTLGPVKGAELQAVLLQLGHNNLSTLRPDQYAEFYQRVEAIA